MTPPSPRPPPRPAELLTALLSGGAGLLQMVEQRSLGFPDGHITALDAAMRAPHLVLSAILIGLGVALVRTGSTRRWTLIGAAVGVLLVDRFGLEILGALMGLEHGQGG